MYKLVDKSFNVSYAEIPQNSQIKFAYGLVDTVKKEITPRHAFIKCTDFFCDAIVSSFTGRDIGIYGFYWMGKDPVWNCDGCMILCLPDIEENLNLEILKSALADCGVSLEGLEYHVLDKNHAAIIYPNIFNSSPLALHTFCYLIRLGTYSQTRELTHWKQLHTVDYGLISDLSLLKGGNYGPLEKVLKNLDKFALRKEDENIQETISQTHNYSGIKTFYMISANPDAKTVSKYMKAGLKRIA